MRSKTSITVAVLVILAIVGTILFFNDDSMSDSDDNKDSVVESTPESAAGTDAESASSSANPQDNNSDTKPTIDVNEIGLARLDENPGELIIDILAQGSGNNAATGDEITVHYLGVLDDGEGFDNSYDRGATFSFTLGEGRVIKGWEQGLLGAKVGDERLLIIPSNLGYGAGGSGSIPPGSTLIFNVKVVAIN